MKFPIKETVFCAVLAIGLVAQAVVAKAHHENGSYAQPPAPRGYIVPNGHGGKVTYDQYGNVIWIYDGRGNPIAHRRAPRYGQRVIVAPQQPHYQSRPMYPPQYVYPHPGTQIILGVLGTIGNVLIARERYKNRRRHR